MEYFWTIEDKSTEKKIVRLNSPWTNILIMFYSSFQELLDDSVEPLEQEQGGQWRIEVK